MIGKICENSAREIFDETSIYIVPMVNPDGVDLVNNYITDENILINTRKIADSYINIPYTKGWKANIRGVDLNLQFPAGWENAKTNKFLAGIKTPAPRDYVGISPLSEKESKALYDFTKAHDFKLILAYHSQGQVIYNKYLDYNPKGADHIGEIFAKLSGYDLEITPAFSGYAGYKDFFIQEYNRPGFTIEVGVGESPVDIYQFNKIYNENINILIISTKLI